MFLARRPDDKALGVGPDLALSAGMIQTTSRLSRGARLRRERPLWPYVVVVVLSVVVLGAVFLLNHPSP
jgi:hypothetical protein